MSKEFMLENGFEPMRIEVLDSSMLGDYVDCPSKFYLRHILGLQPKVWDPVRDAPLDWGTAWHQGMYTYYSPTGGLDAALQKIDSVFPEHIRADTDKHKRSRDRMLKGLVAYHNKWERDNDRYEILRREQFFDVQNDDDGLRWCGRMDGIWAQKKPHKLMVWDFKGTSAMGERYYDQHELSFQFPGYVWAANQLGTEEVMEIRMDVIYTLTASMQFFRRTFRYDTFRIREFVENTKMWVDEIMEMQDRYLYEPEMWKKDWKECTRYRTCSFFKVHSIHPKGNTRLRVLQNDYAVRRWDPSAIEED
jgi:hypothetical protein